MAEQNFQPEEMKMTFGLVDWPGYLGIYIAHDLGFFAEEGLDVELKEYISLRELSEDYQAGEMTGRANLISDAVVETCHGFDHKIVAIVDYSVGSDAIISGNSKINTIKDLVGKKVAYEPQSLEEFFLMFLLNEDGLSKEDIKPLHADPEESARLLLSGQADAAVTFEPYISRLLGDSRFNIVFSSADYPGLIIDVLTFRTDFIEENPEAVSAFSRAYFRGVNFFKHYPDKAALILAKEFNVTAESAEKQLSGLYIPDLEENETAFTFAPGSQSVYGALRKMGRFFEFYHKKANVLDTDNIVESKFIFNLSNQKEQ